MPDRPHVPARRRVASLLVLLALAACGGDGGTDPDSNVPASLRVTLPASPRIGDTLRATVVALNATGRELAPAEGAAPPTITFRGAAVRALAAGVALAVDSGVVIVEATSGTVRGEGRATVVTPPDLALAMTSPDSLRIGDTTGVVQVDARRDGVALAAEVVRMRVLDTAIARLSTRPDGRVTVRPVALGTTTIEARLGARVEQRPLRVLDPALVTFALTVTPQVIDIDDVSTIDITAFDALGNLVTGAGMELSVSGPEATLVGNGGVRGVRPGRVVVEARARGRIATDTLSIVPPSSLTVDVRPGITAGGVPEVLTPRVRLALDRAVKRWRQVLPAELPPQRVIADTSFCGNPRLDETITGMRVYVLERDIPTPGVIAQAAACILRSDGRTVVGAIQFDPVEISTLNDPLLAEIALHEFGHVIGFGSSWERAYASFLSLRGPIPLWTGPGARAAFDLLPNRASWTGGTVPLFADQSHYDVRAMRGELMDPFFRGGLLALSRVTVGVLADMGYEVNPFSWQRFAIPLRGVARPDSGRVIDLRGDIMDRPLMIARPDGRLVRLR